MPSLIERAAQVRLMIFDVDGVLTDGGLYYDAQGEAIKRFNVMDGLGIRLLQQAGITTAIISARRSDIVAKRAADLGIQHVIQGRHDKLQAYQELCQTLHISAAETGFIGDDVVDLSLLDVVGFPVAVANAHADLVARVVLQTKASGGNGAVREVCDLILKAQHKYDAYAASQLK